MNFESNLVKILSYYLLCTYAEFA